MRAIISVSDKTGLVPFAAALSKAGVEIVASGGTADELGRAGIEHREVAEVTGAQEMLDGRVKTLHPAIHGGILADRDKPGHMDELDRAGIVPIDLVICNLYPFRAAPSIETIDIGGVTLLRAAAKNHAHVAVVVDPSDYDVVLEEIGASGAVSESTRLRLAARAFAHTASYDAAIATWVGGADDSLPDTVHIALERSEELRYGENPHQQGARYGRVGESSWWDGVERHSGRELSYLNLVDAEAAWVLCHSVLGIADSKTASVIVKHANPCGVAIGADLKGAYQRAFDADPVSAFGGIIALSGHVDLSLAEAIVANAIADVLIAPSYDDGALALLAARRKNTRVLSAPAPEQSRLAFRQFAGGFLVQERDLPEHDSAAWQVATTRQPSEQERRDAELAWVVCALTGSNAIVLAKDGQVVGVGCGQQNRRDSARLATEKAAGRASGGAAASDAFFPFRDGLDAVCESGATVVAQPGGSVRDDEVIAAANEHQVTMFLTGTRHFRH